MTNFFALPYGATVRVVHNEVPSAVASIMNAVEVKRAGFIINDPSKKLLPQALSLLVEYRKKEKRSVVHEFEITLRSNLRSGASLGKRIYQCPDECESLEEILSSTLADFAQKPQDPKKQKAIANLLEDPAINEIFSQAFKWAAQNFPM